MDEEKCDFWIGLFLTANENIFLDLYTFLYAKTGLVKMESQAQKTCLLHHRPQLVTRLVLSPNSTNHAIVPPPPP
ncbi:hypothetical protein, partial [Vibrio vulnificus]|uniref:hypothetical protein n=1 Tax=Vibrio vulnificus TaxID=672 RepID=UPI001EEAD0D3